MFLSLQSYQRPPLHSQVEMIKPKLIGIVGGSGSGKTTFAQRISKCSRMDSVVLSQDNYYRGLGAHEHPSSYNFDHPDVLELDRMCADLGWLKKGCAASIPIYDFSLHKRLDEEILINPVELVVVEGLFLFTPKEMRELFDIKIFLNVSATDRLGRRLDRDVASRTRSHDEVVWRFNEHCEPAYSKFISPSSKYADLKITPAAGFGPSYDKQISDVIGRLTEK